MSLEVRLLSYKGNGCSSGERIIKSAFRGVAHVSTIFVENEAPSSLNQRLEWPLASVLNKSEKIEIQVLSYNRFLNNRVLGSCMFSLHRLVDESPIRLAASLVDHTGRPLKASLDLEVSYRSPFAVDTDDSLDEEEEEFQAFGHSPSHESLSGQSHHSQLDQEDSLGSPTQERGALLSIEKNITNLERSIANNRRKKGAQIADSAHSDRDNFHVGYSRRRLLPSRSTGVLDQVGAKATKKKRPFIFPNVKKQKTNAIRSVRNVLRFGRSRSSSVEEDERCLMANGYGHQRGGCGGGGGGGNTSDQFSSDVDVETGRATMNELITGHDSEEDRTNEINEVLVELDERGRNQGRSGTKGNQMKKNKKPMRRPKPSVSEVATSLKAQDFQVCITIIEARQLAGLNMDPVVCVQVGDQKRYTSVKESTNCPYYNEYFVFDFHMAPLMLFDKIITLTVLHSRKFLRQGTVVGSFKLDIKTVYDTPDHQFYHKWALLTDPDDITGGPKGYLKCDINVISKGDPVKIPPKSERDEDDIEANLLLPDGVPAERQRAKYIIRIYRADGLPRMNSSIMANLKHAFGGQTRDLVDPYVSVSFAGLTGRTSVKKNSYAPVWNEQIVFTEMFPPLCQRIKLQLRESDTVGDTVIGTHFLDLSQISNDGDKGFIPTFGPTFVHLYGSTRDYSLIDEHSTLNDGLGEGVSYRGRLLIALKTDVSESIDTAPSEVDVQPTQTINEAAYGRREEFFLFGCVMDATMIDKRLSDKGIQFELSMGNAGNSLDGQVSTTKTEETELLVSEDLGSAESLNGTWSSTTPTIKPLSHDRLYYFLPYWDEKPTMYIRATFPDHRRRLYQSNAISKVAMKLEEDMKEIHNMIEMEDAGCDTKLKALFEHVQQGCHKFTNLYKSSQSGLSAPGKTRLDRERGKMCQNEMESIGALARQQKTMKKKSWRDRYRVAQGLLERLRRLIEDPQHGLPDVFLWLISGTKRLAYQRISSREILYSMVEEEKGRHCGVMKTIFLKLPGRRGAGASGWMIQAKLQVYFWLGSSKHKKSYPSGLPPGFQITNELLNAERPALPPPISIHYSEKHFFQLRAHMYQARSLIGSDASGLSDPFARVICGEYCKTTQVIDETLSPTWDELLVFEEILVYGRREDIKDHPPSIIIEIYDQDKVGKAEFLGRAIGKPHVFLADSTYKQANLEWFQIYRGNEEAGDLLAAFELFELGESDGSLNLPPLPDAKEAVLGGPTDSGPILPIPKGVRPTLAKYRFEVLFWGLRDLKRVQFLTVDRPRVDVECAGHIIQSSVILNTKKNPNFSATVKFLDIELPEQDIYCPPLTIRVVDCRSFGRFTLVGTHVINSIHKFVYQPVTKRDREAEQKKKQQLALKQQMKYAQEMSATSKPRMGGLKLTPKLPKQFPKPPGYARHQSVAPTTGADTQAPKDLLALPGDNTDSVRGIGGATSTLELSPLIPKAKDSVITLDYGTYAIPSGTHGGDSNHQDSPPQQSNSSGIGFGFGARKSAAAIENGGLASPLGPEEDEESMDWWTKYFASVDAMIEEGRLKRGENLVKSEDDQAKSDGGGPLMDEALGGRKKRQGFKSMSSAAKSAASRLSPKGQRKKKKSTVALMKVFPNELEAQSEYHGFTEWLQTFDLYRGKKGEEEFEDDGRIVGKFKGAIKIYKLPLPKDLDDHTVMGFDPQYGFFQGLPSNDPLHVLVRVYVVKANDLHPMDMNGKADPYLVLQLGSKRVSDKENYVSKQLNPVFGKCFEFEATFPQDSILSVSVLDWDLLGSDDLIGETKIDLENRFYSRHRATCGIAARYDPCGYNQWRDPMKPVQLLTKLCKEGKVDGPHFSAGKVRVGEKTFTLQKDDKDPLWQQASTKMSEEHLALAVLHHWHEIPRVGTKLVPEHVETRALYNPDKPGIEQGKVELWVDLFPMDMPLPGLPLDVSPRKPSPYELRVIIWNTDEVVLEDDAFFSGDKMSDIYVKGWLKGPDDAQQTDVHYRSLTGEGNFNWRFIFPFDYLAAEEKVVISKKESMFSWDETTSKVPARMTLQVWDADHFSKDDFLGAITLDLNRFPRGAKTVKQCSLDMLKTDGSVPMVNLFKQKRCKGWWPLYIKTDNEGLLLQGKVEAELILLASEEAEKSPAGLGREDPNALEKPTRPDSSFMWFLNPIKSIRYIVWHNYKWTIIKVLLWLFTVLFLAMFFYALPGYTVKKIMGA